MSIRQSTGAIESCAQARPSESNSACSSTVRVARPSPCRRSGTSRTSGLADKGIRCPPIGGGDMKVLFIGGTGLISSACFGACRGAGHRAVAPQSRRVGQIPAPGGRPGADRRCAWRRARPCPATRGTHLRRRGGLDTAFTPSDVERDIRLFSNRTRQFVFISSASAYQTPPAHYLITEETPLDEPVLAVLTGQDGLRASLDGRAPGTRVPGDHRPSVSYLRPVADPRRHQLLAAPLHPHRSHAAGTDRSSSTAMDHRSGS